MTLTVKPLNPTLPQAWQLTPDNTEWAEAFAAVAQLGYKGEHFMQPNSTSLVWRLSCAGAKDMTGRESDWIVCDGGRVRLLTNDVFAAEFTADVPMQWGLSVPYATAEDGVVTLTFPPPLSANRPWTFTATAVNAETEVSSNATVDETVEADGRVTLTLSGVAEGDYTFTVTAHTQYDATATSVQSNQVTV